MKTSKLLLTILLSSIFYFSSCSSDNNDDNPPIIPPVDPIEELEGIIEELDALEGYSQFLGLLKDIDISNLDNGALTILAFPDEAINGRSYISEVNDETIIKRHILEGKYTKNDLKKNTTLKTIGGTSVSIETDDSGDIYISGVKILDENNVSNSVIYGIEKIIPEKEESIVFNVLQCYADYDNKTNIDQSFPLENTEIFIYDSNFKLVKTIITDKNGQAILKNKSSRHVYYKAGNNDSGEICNIKEGWEIIGIISSFEEAAHYPIVEGTKRNFVGDIKYKDVNGDGKIDNNDIIEYATIPNEENVTVYVDFSSGSHLPIIDFTEYTEDTTQELEKFKLKFIEIDTALSSLEERQKIDPYNLLVQDIYSNGYSVMRYCNYGINYIKQDNKANYNFQKELHILKGYRAQLYYDLSILFGDLIIVDGSFDDIYYTMQARETLENVYIFINDNFKESIKYPSIENTLSYSIFELNNKKYSAALELANQVLISEPDSYLANLIKIESSVYVGDLPTAIKLINKLNIAYSLSVLETTASKEQVLNNLKQHYSMNGSRLGLTFLNKVRFEETAEWPEMYKLLPIPINEIRKNPKMTQNPGWGY